MTAPGFDRPPKVLALSGGIGGAKLDLGLYHVLKDWELAIVANSGDDFVHLGLMICPDLDTIMYTLSGRSDDQKGWGVAGESWACLDQLKALGGPGWFGLGDRDLAVHLYRSDLMRQGVTLSDVTRRLNASFGVTAQVLPMSDQPVGTIVHTQDGRDLPFQRYFVQERCRPAVRDFTYSGIEQARPAAGLLDIITDPALDAIVICPSNPFVSINPILAVPGVRDALCAASAPIVAVSPLVGGRSVKGPLGDMLMHMGLPSDNTSIAAQYADLLSGMIVDTSDADGMGELPCPAIAVPTVMDSLEDRMNLARDVLAFADRLREG